MIVLLSCLVNVTSIAAANIALNTNVETIVTASRATVTMTVEVDVAEIRCVEIVHYPRPL
jgi:acetolactate synthase regulatory subunit